MIVASVPNSACPRRKKMPTDDIPRKLLRLLGFREACADTQDDCAT